MVIDSPGHAAFVTLRRRGGAVADLAILVIDVTEGVQEQTDECLRILKEFKTPFVVAATKIDKIPGWYPHPNRCFLDSFSEQSEDVKEDLEGRLYKLIAQLAERNVTAEIFDRIKDFRKQTAIVPVSGATGEGVPELLMILSGLAQQFLQDRLQLSETPHGTILEVKDVRGLGTTIDVILYDGSVSKGDYLIVGGKKPLVTKIRALLRPRPLQELRVEKRFESVDRVDAAAGIKIVAPNLDDVIPGSPIVATKKEEEIEKLKLEVQKEVEKVEFEKEIDGVLIVADTLGSLEAMIRILREEKVPIRKAKVGSPNRQDLVELEVVKDKLRRVLLAFNVRLPVEIKTLARDLRIKFFENNVIYRLVEDYKKWCVDEKERELSEKLARVTRPVEVKILRGTIFRASNPAVFGVEIIKGMLKPGVLMRRKDGKIIGKVKEIQKGGRTLHEARKGDKVAISMDEPTVGRQIKEGDILFSVLSENDLKVLKEVYDRLTDSEKELLTELNINLKEES